MHGCARLHIDTQSLRELRQTRRIRCKLFYTPRVDKFKCFGTHTVIYEYRADR